MELRKGPSRRAAFVVSSGPVRFDRAGPRELIDGELVFLREWKVTKVKKLLPRRGF